MGQVAGDSTSVGILFSHLGEYLDEELAPEMKAKMDQWLQEAGNQNLLDQFVQKRGQLQIKLQELTLSESVLLELRGFAQDRSVQATQEVVHIEQFGRREGSSQFVRKMVLGVIALGLGLFLVWRFAPRSGPTFKPLEYLGFEALMLEESKEERLNLPTNEINEIRQFFSSNPDLSFAFKVLKDIPDSWEPDGASVIDYEIEKVGVVQYHHKETSEKLFHFSYKGELSDLPKAETGNMRSLVFQTYSSDSLNLIAWQSAPSVTSILVGRRSAPELAEIAVLGSTK